ncbi:Aldehyde/histidinol dehydrogenase [Fusarium redolens]|uniref:Aldehyde/histidinol dehydrogenase n=1 Tax=Fusarium redolens TaxID=48865 RepID=A0A9P9GKD6_FUSRE|nr:Aldehyde/histidinol dehydrogenase [Fusarium redolens]KAH7240766.1 Aldehyde/histidinol dehydrogenase [Fusarium redolens]
MAYSLPFKLNRPDLLTTDSYIEGQTKPALSGSTFDVLDPGTNKPWTRVTNNSADDVDATVRVAHKAFQSFKKTSPRARAQWLLKWDALIREHKADLATLLVYETGKPYIEAIGEMDYSLTFVSWFAGEAERIQGTCFAPSAPDRRVVTIKQPLGVAVALVPWNFPVAMVLRKAAAALAAGCTMVVKPSPETPVTAMALAKLASEAGFPDGVLNVLPTSLENTPSLSEALCKHELVKKVTFTGSTRVGTLVANHCSLGLKKVVLELGGNCPCLIFDDADIEAALRELVGLKWRHAGQACVTVNRFLVQSGVYDKFLQRFVEETAKYVVGHGAAEGTTLGPVTKPESLDRAERLIKDAVGKGARIVTGGNRVSPKGGEGGYFFEPTILADMSHDTLISCEECFAPIAAFYKFETEEEAVQAANDTPMGLASYAFTKNADRIWRMLENLEAGMIALNTGNSSAAESPFGGIKMSGYGKEAGKDVAIIPVSWSDQPNPIPNLRTRTFFITDHPLDEQILKNGLDKLIRNHWRKLGARLSPSHGDTRLEYHLPHVFPDNYELFKWSSVSAGYSYGETYELSKILHPGDGINVLPAIERIDARVRPHDWPFERKDEPPDSPLLYVHLTRFSDGAVLAMSVPHVFADQGGLANIVKAWLAVIEGKTPPEMMGYKDDVLGSEKLSNLEADPGERIGRMRIRSMKDQALVTGRIALDLVRDRKEESRTVFLPMQVVKNLREKVRERLDGKHIFASEISNGDIITAIFTKLVRINSESKYEVSLSSTINLRDRILELQGERGEGYVHNAVHYATAKFAIKPETQLDEIALQNRIAVNEALKESDIKAGVSTLREVAKAGQVMLICEPHHKLYSSSNWSGSWQGIDFTKAAPASYDLTSHRKEMVVLGQSKTLKAPMRYRVVIMCRTSEGFWCDFAAPVKTMRLVERFFTWDPSLGILLEEMDADLNIRGYKKFKHPCLIL